jgi:hypothetical protein
MRAVIATVVFALSGAGFAQGNDVGLVSLVSGEVSYNPSAGPPGKVQAFMRVRDGDRFELASGSQLRIVLFAAARQERWVGPASFRAGASASQALSGKPAEVTNLPAAAPQRIARVPELLLNAKLGGIQVRGGITPRQQASLDQQETLRDARKTYSAMRTQFPSDDITPELYLYSALHEYLLYDEMKPVVAEMLRKQPNNDELRNLESWVKSRAR